MVSAQGFWQSISDITGDRQMLHCNNDKYKLRLYHTEPSGQTPSCVYNTWAQDADSPQLTEVSHDTDMYKAED